MEGDADTLAMLEACDIIKVDAADDVVFTEKGRRVLVSGYELGEAEPLLQKRDTPLKDMNGFELMLELEDKGWRCEVVSKKDKRYKELRKKAYLHGQEKVWYVLFEGMAVNRSYWLALLTAEMHPEKQVPHFGATSCYKEIMEVEEKPCVSRQKLHLVLEDDPWDFDPDSLRPERKPRGGRRAKPARDEVPELEGDLVLGSSECDGSFGSCAGTPSAASSSKSITASSSSRPSRKSKSGSRPSSPGHSSCSGGDGSAGEAELADGDLGKGAGKGKKGAGDAKGKGGGRGPGSAARGGWARNPHVAEPFGRGRITPKYKAFQGEPFSYQMTCGFRGHICCNRTLSVAKVGDTQTCLRMLKQWAALPILDPSIVDKPAHKADSEWLKIAEAEVAGTLMSEGELDRLAVESSWGWT